MDPLMAHTVLRRELTKGATDRYSVTKYCRSAGIGRGTFYGTYAGLNDLFCTTLQFELDRIFNDHHHHSWHQLLFAIIREIGDYRVYYSNIYRIIKKRKSSDLHVCDELKDTIFRGMQNHLSNSNYSNKRIRGVSNMIFSRLTTWISHSCKDRVIDIYGDLSFLIPYDNESTAA